MHLNTRSTIGLLLLAFSVGAFGCVEPTEQADNLATVSQEIVLFSAKPGIDNTALSFGYSQVDGWQLLRYADVQTATDFGDAFKARQQEMNFSGSAAPKGRFRASLVGSTPISGPNYSSSFSGETMGYHSFQGKIAGGTGLSCSIYIICDIVEALCDSLQGMPGSSSSSCQSSVNECRASITEGMGSLNPKEEQAFCAIFDFVFSGGFSQGGKF